MGFNSWPNTLLCAEEGVPGQEVLACKRGRGGWAGWWGPVGLVVGRQVGLVLAQEDVPA